MKNKPQKALSIRQPWAWLIIHGYKDVENRSWETSIRGKIYIHAGKTFDYDGYYWVKKRFEIDLPLPENFDHGGLVGIVDLIDCVSDCRSDWFIGPYGFILRNPEKITFIPMKGKLGFFPIGESKA